LKCFIIRAASFSGTFIYENLSKTFSLECLFNLTPVCVSKKSFKSAGVFRLSNLPLAMKSLTSPLAATPLPQVEVKSL
jgi:hypothetical protein